MWRAVVDHNDPGGLVATSAATGWEAAGPGQILRRREAAGIVVVVILLGPFLDDPDDPDDPDDFVLV